MPETLIASAALEDEEPPLPDPELPEEPPLEELLLELELAAASAAE